MSGSTARAINTEPMTLASNIRRQSAGARSKNGAYRPMPAHAITWSAGPSRERTVAHASRTAASSVTSQAIGTAPSPHASAVLRTAASSTSSSASRCRRAASASAVARPMPLPAPVTIETGAVAAMLGPPARPVSAAGGQPAVGEEGMPGDEVRSLAGEEQSGTDVIGGHGEAPELDPAAQALGPFGVARHDVGGEL